MSRAAGLALQVRPYRFDAPALRALLGLGIRWYVTEAPRAFHEGLTAASARNE